jgi:chromosome segregation ATPase
MQTNFAPIGQLQTSHTGDNSFWPSFTDIMMVITMIFLMATSLLVVRNWQLVAELRESVAAEQLATQLIETTSEENATLEERLANAEQSNSILRLRLLKKDEELLLANDALRQQENQIISLEIENADFKQALNQANAAIAAANLEIDNTRTLLSAAKTEIESLTQSSQAQQQNISSLTQDKQRLNQEIEAYKRQLLALKSEYRALLSTAKAEIESLTQSSQTQQDYISNLTQDKQRLDQEIEAYKRQLAALKDEYRTLLSTTKAEIESLTQSNQTQQESISSLTRDKQLLNQEIETYNRQLLTLKGDYEVVKSKYEELIKPARSAKGKYIAEVYYIKGKSGKIIRYKQPGDSDFTDLPLSEVEKRLSILKTEWGKDLYVKIIIPQDSGLTYSEAWDFMRNLLVKYDYYYQEN